MFPLPHRHFIKRLHRNLLFFSTTNLPPPATLAFLQNSCHLPPQTALAIAAKLNLRGLANPHAVLSLLKQFSFSDADVAAFISRSPRFLNSRPTKNLHPKLQFLSKTLGLHPKTILLNPRILRTSLRNRLIPNYAFLESLGIAKEKITRLLREAPYILMLDLKGLAIPRIQALRDSDVSEEVIRRVFTDKSLYQPPGKFEEALEMVKQVEISRCAMVFARALEVFAEMPKHKLEWKMSKFRELGWSQEQIIKAFAKHPYFIRLSVDKVRRSMKFFEEKFDWGPEFLCGRPVLLALRLENRIMLRYAVWQILVSKGFVSPHLGISYFYIGEDEFLRKYVFKYQLVAPEVIDVFKSDKKVLEGSKQNQLSTDLIG